MAIIEHAGSTALSREIAPDHLDEAASLFASASKSLATRRAYHFDWVDFVAFCERDNATSAPAESRTVCRYFADLVELGRAATTIDRRASAIAFAHRALGFDAPTGREEVRAVLAGIRNQIGRRPAKKQALTAELLAKVLRKIKTETLIGIRDRALLLLCFGAALRRSELVGLGVADLEFDRKGLLVRLGKTKTDQAGKGRSVAVPDGKLRIPEAVKDWLIAGKITEGAIFRGIDDGRVSPKAITPSHFARIVKARCAAIGLDPGAFSGHSCRRGWATSAGEAGADLRHTANHMRHAKLETTMGYIEDADLFRHNPGKGFV